MQPTSSLTKRRQFEAVREHGQPHSNALVSLRTASNGSEVTRYGFTVSRRVGKAVVRNRVKRRMREAVRHVPVISGLDIVITAREGMASASYLQIQKALHDVLRRARVLVPLGTIPEE